MRIDHLLLDNFKGFSRRELSFHPQFNLVVGENGTGKTSLLDALAVAAGSWFLGISGVETRSIYPYEVRLQPFPSEAGTHWEGQYPCSIEASGSIGGASLLWRRSLKRPGGRTTYIDAAEIKTLAEQATYAVRDGKAINLPLISSTAPVASGLCQGNKESSRTHRAAFSNKSCPDWMVTRQALIHAFRLVR